MKFFIVSSLLLIPFVSFASIPDFPMAFWGSVTIDDVLAPSGAIVRVYDANETEIGEIEIKENGVYGYTEPTKQKLIVGEGVGELTFTIQTATINNGIETKGTQPITHSAFVSGEVFEKDLNFEIVKQTLSSGGGGGGSSKSGGGSKKVKDDPEIEKLVLGATTTVLGGEEDEKIALQKQIIALLTQLISLLQLQLQVR